MRIRFLGTGSAEPDSARFNVSLLVKFDNCCFLVDCSGSPAQSIMRAGPALDSLSDLILTHTHTDHIYALPSLIHSIWLRGGSKPGKRLDIHGLPEVTEFARKLVGIFGLEEKTNAVQIGWHQIHPPESISLAAEVSWRTEAFKVDHGETPTVGLRFTREQDHFSILYSADAIANERLKSQLTPNVRILIQDCGGRMEGTDGHAGARTIGRMISGSDLEAVYLVHLPPVTSAEKTAILAEVARTYSGKVIIPNDGDEVSIPQ